MGKGGLRWTIDIDVDIVNLCSIALDRNLNCDPKFVFV